MTVVLALLAIIAVTVIWAVMAYNGLVSNRQKLKEGWSGIDVQLKRRFDLVPNLVETVKAYAKHEDKVLNEVTASRTDCQKAQSSSVENRAQVESILSGALGRLIAVAENYPDLKANQNFAQLQKNLFEIEDNIQMARRYYNGSARDFNTSVQSFPTNIIANKFGFKTEPFFEISNSAEKEVVQVKF
ncbi:MAG: LemA family protein [Proteobacteria bacterium]|nr:LemA family protein [Pseudomonadota bacterium]